MEMKKIKIKLKTTAFFGHRYGVYKLKNNVGHKSEMGNKLFACSIDSYPDKNNPIIFYALII